MGKCWFVLVLVVEFHSDNYLDSTLTWGSGNIDADPLFADPENGDYHLKSEFGRWDPTANNGAGGFVLNAETSPCIDGGDPESDYCRETQRNGGRINMGAYGGTLEASKSGSKIPGDVNDDCKVNVLDLIAVRNHLYQSADTGDNWRYDINDDGVINILDLLFVRDHLRTSCE